MFEAILSITASLHPCDVRTPLCSIHDASSNIPEEESPHPLVDCKGDHLRDGWKACDWSVVRRIFSVSTLVDEDGPPFEEPVVRIVPPISIFPFDHLFHQLEDGFLDLLAFLDGDGIHGIDPACFPWCRAAEDFFEFVFRKLKPPASPSFLE